MSRERNVVFPPWTWPLIVAAIVVPITAGMILQGPGVGLAAGALMAAAIVVLAVRQKPDGPIEAAPARTGRRHLLVVISEAADEPAAVEEIAALARPGEDEEPTEVLVLAAARERFLDRWASHVEPGRREAQRKLVLSVAALAAARVEARGQVGDPDLVQATEDALRSFPAERVVLVTGHPDSDPAGVRAATELGRRLEPPFDHVSLPGAPSLGQSSGVLPSRREPT